MIAYLPELYEDELVYSWFARYFAHMYPSYTNALEDLLENRNIRTDMEFINRLHPNAKTRITKIIPTKELILQHTLFKYYRFADNTRLRNALRLMAESGGDAHQLLPISPTRIGTQVRHIKYCPICATKARETCGEAFWTRQANLRSINICTKHRCRLKTTSIEISGKKSGRLYVAEEVIDDIEPEMVEDSLEIKLSEYMIAVFCNPINLDNSVPVGDFLRSRLEGSKYLSARGMQVQISLLLSDLMDFYKELQEQWEAGSDSAEKAVVFPGITQKHQLQHIFSGKSTDFYKICLLSFFLNNVSPNVSVSPNELTNPRLPQRKSQTEVFNDKVAQLYAQGLGCHRIARELGCCPSTAQNANKKKSKAEHDYSVRKGIKRADWSQMDIDMLQQVRDICEQIYHNAGGRPGRVTVSAVCRELGFPGKRFDYLPKCKAVIQEYAEDFPIFWSREVVWCYQYLVDTIGEDAIRWRNIRDITNLRKKNFWDSFPYLHLFADKETVGKIRNLLPVSESE